MFHKRIPKISLCCLLLIHIQASGYTENSQDQTSSRTNTLFDDADDIQRQLDNEARDRIKFGRPKTIWVFHFPTHFTEQNSLEEATEEQVRCPRQLQPSRLDGVEYEDDGAALEPLNQWEYTSQGNWSKVFPQCGEKSQSPVDVPLAGLIKPRGTRRLMFHNHNVAAKTMTLTNDGRQMVLFGEWKSKQRPVIYGGPAHSRRYLFHSLVIHLPAEHTVGTIYYPLETQVFYVSAEYKDMDQALDSSASDPQAILAVANLYSYANDTHKGLMDILTAAKNQGMANATIKGNSLSYFNPTFKEYACYQGSLTTPPCTESVIWLIRGRTLHIKRETWEAAEKVIKENAAEENKHVNFRSTQPLNDRKVFYFK